jgi:hypothetical protein
MMELDRIIYRVKYFKRNAHPNVKNKKTLIHSVSMDIRHTANGIEVVMAQ